MRELRVEDALMYLDQVKMEFGDRPHIYNEFLDIMKAFKSQQVDTPGVIQRVSALFHGNKRLVLGFNTFLPDGYKIELTADGSGPVVYREPGRQGVTQITWPGGPPLNNPPSSSQQQHGGPPGHAASNAQGQSLVAARGGPPLPGPRQLAPPGGGGGRGPPPPGHPSMRGGPPPLAPGSASSAPGGQQQQQQQQQQQRHVGAPGGGGPQPPPRPGQFVVGPPSSGGYAPGKPPNAPGGPQQQQQQQHGGPPGSRMGGPPHGHLQQQQQQQQQHPNFPPSGPLPPHARPPMPGGPGPHPGQVPSSAVQQQQQQQQQQHQQQQQYSSPAIPPPQPPNAQPVEFDHAINYVTTIKKRFAAHPEIYRKFLEILHTYQKEQRGIKEVLDEVSILFADHADLLKEFTYFLPDAVQSQAKAQLDKMAEIAEQRARDRASGKYVPPVGKGSAPVVPLVGVGAGVGGMGVGMGAGGRGAGVGGGPKSSMGRGRGAPPMMPAGPPMGTPNAVGAKQLTSPMVLQAPPSSALGGSPAPPTGFAPVSTAVASKEIQIPFGATQGRSEEREKEIKKGVHHGTVSFAPVRPPRRNALNPAQAAQTHGRPKTIPESPFQPTTAESVFFDEVKTHFNRTDIFPDKPTISRKQTPYTEFIKCLHLFGAGVLSKKELIQLLRGLFIQGTTPKSGQNAATASANSVAIYEANILVLKFEKLLIGRGPYAVQEENQKYKAKYGSYPIREYDISDTSQRLTTSYWSTPTDFIHDVCSGAQEKDAKVLNIKCVSIAKDWLENGDRMLKSPEEYDGVKARCNVYEEVLCRIEDEMYEYEMAIERNSYAIRQLDNIAEEATRLREQEEKDGQPIGRLQYKLPIRSLNHVHIGAIARVYGESGDEVVQHLLSNALVVLPIVCQRLKEKDAEWRKVKSELSKEWKVLLSDNYEGSLDVLCYFYKRELEKSFYADRLLEDCRRAKSFAKHPSKIPRHPSTDSLQPDFQLTNENPDLTLYQPYFSLPVSKNMPHKDAYGCLEAYFSGDASKLTSDDEKFVNVWKDFIAPWFGLPTEWTSENSDNGNQPDKGVSTAKFVAGQRVRTTVGDGQIISVAEGKTPNSFRYLIKFPFGVGYVRPSAIAHLLPSINAQMDESSANEAQLMKDDIQVLFGTEKIYLFMRLYVLLVTMFSQAKDIVEQSSATSNNVTQTKPISGSKDISEQSTTFAGYAGVVSKLKDLIRGKMDGKDFETGCRKVANNSVYHFVSIPRLVEKCAEALVKVSNEDVLETLHHCSQLKLKDLSLLRSLCLDVTDEAAYRIQIQSSTDRIFFSYLPNGVDLQLSNPGDAKSSDSDGVPPMKIQGREPMDKEGEFQPEQKRMKTD